MNVRFVLVRCSYPSNMGAAARALKVMGFHDLWFVSPGRPITHERAIATATHGADILEGATVCQTLDEALSNVDLVVGTTIKARVNIPLKVSVRDLRAHCEGILAPDSTVAILFGAESTGMTNAELERCDLVASIPTAAAHPSLNLAQAIMIFAYELSVATQIYGKTKLTAPELPAGEYRHFVEQVEQFLEHLGVGPEQRAYKDVRARLAMLDASDIRLLRFLKNRLDGMGSRRPR